LIKADLAYDPPLGIALMSPGIGVDCVVDNGMSSIGPMQPIIEPL